MRLSLIFLLCLQLSSMQVLFAQSHDTTITLTDQTTDSVRQLVKQQYERYQDSMRAVRIKQEVAKNGKSLDALLQEAEEREKAEQRQIYFRVGLGVLFLIVLGVGLARRKKWNR